MQEKIDLLSFLVQPATKTKNLKKMRMSDSFSLKHLYMTAWK